MGRRYIHIYRFGNDLRFHYAKLVQIGDFTICVSGNHAVGDKNEFWFVYMSLVLFVVPAVLEVILWVCLSRSTRTTREATDRPWTAFSLVGIKMRRGWNCAHRESVTSDDIVTTMQRGLVRSAMFDTLGYILCWGPFNFISVLVHFIHNYNRILLGRNAVGTWVISIFTIKNTDRVK